MNISKFTNSTLRKDQQTALLLLCGIILVLCPGSALAATINVTPNATDTLDGADGQCSLREAITNINNGGIGTTYADCASTGAYGSDTIMLPAGTYALIGELDITKSLIINGAGVSSTTIDGAALGRVFYISPGVTAVISNLTIQNGSGSPGGAIYNRGTLTLTNSTVRNNSTYNLGGGGIYNIGTLTLARSTVSGNSSTFKGGGILNDAGATAILSQSTVSGNTSVDPGHGNGGGYLQLWHVNTDQQHRQRQLVHPGRGHSQL